MTDFDTGGLLELDASDFVAESEDAADASEDFSDSAEDTQETLFDFDAAGAAAGAGIATAGGAMTAATQGSQDWRESLGRTASTIGATQEETEDLATEISDATFPMDDAVDTMDILAQAGIDSEEEMAELAGTFDNVGDATGDSAANVADNMVPALRAMGEDVEDAGDHMDTFTHISRNTTADIDDFSRMVRRSADDLEDMDVSVDDTAAVMAALEDQGMDSRTAMREFQQATGQDGVESLDDLTTELDISEDAFGDQMEAIENAEGITEEHAEAANESVTTMDRLSARMDDVMLSAGSLLGPIDALGPALMAAGGAASILSSINMAAVVPSLTAVMTALSPVLPVILGLAAVAAVLFAAWQTNFLGIQDIVADVVEWLRESIGEFVGWIEELWTEHGEDLLETISETWSIIQEAISEVFEFLRAEVFEPFVSWLEDMWHEHGEELAAEVIETWDVISAKILDTLTVLEEDVIEPFVEFVEPFVLTFLETLQDAWDRWGDDIIDVVTAVVDFAINYVELLVGNFTELVSGMLSLARGDFEGFRDSIETIISDTISFILSPFRALYRRLVGNSIIPDMIADIQSVFSGLTDWFSSTWDVLGTVIGVFEGLRDDALGIAEEIFDGLVSTFGDIGDAIGSNVSEAFNSVVPSSVDLPSVTVGGQSFSTEVAGQEIGGSLPTQTIGGQSMSLPQLNTGGVIEDDGMAMVHEGEHVFNPAKADKGNPDPGGTTVNIDTLVAEDPRSAARELERELSSLNL